MRENTQSQILRGIIPPMVTPLTAHEALDLEGLGRLIEHLIGGGVSGIFILGTTGEAPSLGYPLRRELIVQACNQVNGRVPVMVGVSDTSIEESISLGAVAAKAGATALVAAPPFYFDIGQKELGRYFERLLGGIGLPLFLYNMPGLTKISIGVELVRRFIQDGRVIGIKDSSGDMMYFQSLIGLARMRKDWSVLNGTEGLLAESVIMGGHGAVAGGANVFPELFVRLYQAATSMNMPEVLRLQASVRSLGDQLYLDGLNAPSVVKGIKHSLEAMGICSGSLACPFSSFDEEQVRIISNVISKIDFLSGRVNTGDDRSASISPVEPCAAS